MEYAFATNLYQHSYADSFILTPEENAKTHEHEHDNMHKFRALGVHGFKRNMQPRNPL